MRSFLFAVVILVSLQVKGQDAGGHIDECASLDEKAVLLAKQQRVTDSIALVNIRAQAVIATQAEAVPQGAINNIRFTISNDRISGFFKPVGNASQYVSVLSSSPELQGSPANGRRYQAGDHIGNGTVISTGSATAFTATSLSPNTPYYVYVFAGNDNTAQGIIYNHDPGYKGQMTTGSNPPLNYYYGNLHSHSSYSDGNKDNLSLVPSDDYAYAKNSLCMDFLGIAEHNHYSSARNPGMHVADYQPGINQANAFTAANPGFLALYGMEWGVISNGGHTCVYGVDSLVGWEILNSKPNYDIYVTKSNYTGSNGLFSVINSFIGKKAFASFAHPDYSDYNNIANVPYDAAADSAVVGSAVESGPAFSTDTHYSDPASMSFLGYYTKMLSKGYHLGPWIDHDTHNLTFGRSTNARLVVLAPTINKGDFFDAMRAMHFYATENCNTQVDFQVDGEMMGSIITRPQAPAITITAGNTNMPGATPTIHLYSGTPGSNLTPVIIATTTGKTLTYTDNVLANKATAYYYADITINGSRTLSAPIWYTRDDSAVVAVPAALNLATNSVAVLGNPVMNDELHLVVTAANVQDVQVMLIDVAGRNVAIKTVHALQGANDVRVAMHGLAKGTYFVSTRFDGSTDNRIIVK